MNWSQFRGIIDGVNANMCGNASFSDIRTLLVRNSLWEKMSNVIW